MTASTSPAVATAPRTALLLATGFVVAGAANSVIAFAALAAGADPAFPPLLPPVYLAFTALGLLGAYAGWRLVRRIAPRPAAALRVLVPVALVLSFVPNVVLELTRFIPTADLTGVIGLSLMHVVVAAVAVPLFQRIAPVS